MQRSIAVFGAGPGLGQAVAHRYAREGYAVVLVARRQPSLAALADDLVRAGATVHAVTADLSDADAVSVTADQIRAKVGDLDAFYYGLAAGGFVPAVDLTRKHVDDFMPLAVHTLLALVREFLPHMVEQREGAILVAQGASAVQGLPNMSGPGPGLAAQRNYLQSLHAEIAEKGIYVGRLYIGSIIEHSAFHADVEAARAAGDQARDWGPVVDPAHLADLLWTMHSTKDRSEVIYPDGIFDRPDGMFDR